jgi:hypothetical protein
MSVLSPKQRQFADAARKVYEARLKDQLEREHAGKVIAIEPVSGDFVLGDTYFDVDQQSQQRFGDKPVYFFRVGGGGAVKIRGAARRGRVLG